MEKTRQIDALIDKAKNFEKRAEDGDETCRKEAIKSFEEAIKLSEKNYGYTHDTTLDLLQAWAYNVRATGDLDWAIKCNQKYVGRASRKLYEMYSAHGKHHQNVTDAKIRLLNAQRQQADTYQEDKNFSKAADIYAQVVNWDVRRSKEAPYKDRTDLAFALVKTKSIANIRRALQLNTETLKLAEQNLGESHIQTVNARYILAKALYSLRRFRSAFHEWKKLLEILEAEDCSARSSSEYDHCLKVVKRSLENCATKIARYEERKQAESAGKGKTKHHSIPDTLQSALNVEYQRTEHRSTRRSNPGVNTQPPPAVKCAMPNGLSSDPAALDPYRETTDLAKEVRYFSGRQGRTRRSDDRRINYGLSTKPRPGATEESSEKQEPSYSSSSWGKLEQNPGGQRTTTQSGESARSFSIRREKRTSKLDKTTKMDARDGVTSSGDQSNPGLPICVLGLQKEYGSNLDSISSPASKSQELTQRRPSAPSIFLSRPPHPDEKQSFGIVDDESHREAGRKTQRPKSSQAYFHTPSSSLDTVERRKSQSRSNDAKRALSPSSSSEIMYELEGASEFVSSAAESTDENSDAEAERQLVGSSEKNGLSPPEETPNPSAESWSCIAGMPQDLVSKPVLFNIVALPEHASAMSKNSSDPRQAEPIIPGGWHQDFDGPKLQKISKIPSNEAPSEGDLQVSQTGEAMYEQAGSVCTSQSLFSTREVPSAKDWSPAAEIIADEWFKRLRNHAHEFLDEYQKDCYGVTKRARRVKIAVLDTGVAKNSTNGSVPPLLKSERVKPGKLLDPSLPWDFDSKGHGTHAVGLVLTVCPYADVYVYRVCEGSSSIDKKNVADAIVHAVNEKKVDIISMSLGWEDNSHDELRQAIRHARAADVLLFAATSNEGIQPGAGMAFPARAPEVIAVDAANVHGRPLESNPRGANQKERGRLTALGQAVWSTWPSNLPTDEPEMGSKRLAGTSCATPILAGVAGLVLEFARQRPLCFEHEIEKHLKTVEGMHLVLKDLLSLECNTDVHFNILTPTTLFHVTEKCPKGGHWAESFSPRFDAAHRIVNVLRKEFGDQIGSVMSREIRDSFRNEEGGG